MLVFETLGMLEVGATLEAAIDENDYIFIYGQAIKDIKATSGHQSLGAVKTTTAKDGLNSHICCWCETQAAVACPRTCTFVWVKKRNQGIRIRISKYTLGGWNAKLWKRWL